MYVVNGLTSLSSAAIHARSVLVKQEERICTWLVDEETENIIVICHHSETETVLEILSHLIR
jgi:hypothetical protein